MKAFYKKRLLKLADKLDEIAAKKKEKFDLCVIGTIPAGVEPTVQNIKCKATACAIGWCPTIFRNVKWDIERALEEFTEYPNDQITVNVLFEGEEDFDGAQKFFGLRNSNDSEYLFDPPSYPDGRRGPKSVANRIRHYVKCDGCPKYPMKFYSWGGEGYPEASHVGLKG